MYEARHCGGPVLTQLSLTPIRNRLAGETEHRTQKCPPFSFRLFCLPEHEEYHTRRGLPGPRPWEPSSPVAS